MVPTHSSHHKSIKQLWYTIVSTFNCSPSQHSYFLLLTLSVKHGYGTTTPTCRLCCSGYVPVWFSLTSLATAPQFRWGVTTHPVPALSTATHVYILFVASHNTTSVQSPNSSCTCTVSTPRHNITKLVVCFSFPRKEYRNPKNTMLYGWFRAAALTLRLLVRCFCVISTSNYSGERGVNPARLCRNITLR
jgi:hypothetical protein